MELQIFIVVVKNTVYLSFESPPSIAHLRFLGMNDDVQFYRGITIAHNAIAVGIVNGHIRTFGVALCCDFDWTAESLGVEPCPVT